MTMPVNPIDKLRRIRELRSRINTLERILDAEAPDWRKQV